MKIFRDVGLFDPEDEGVTIPRNFGGSLPADVA
jgi:hypothetical protein